MTISPAFSALLNTKLTSLEKKLQSLIMPLSVLAENEQPKANNQQLKAKLCKQCGESFTYTHNRAMYCPTCREIVYKTKNQKRKLKASTEQPTPEQIEAAESDIDQVLKEIKEKNKQPYKFND